MLKISKLDIKEIYLKYNSEKCKINLKSDKKIKLTPHYFRLSNDDCFYFRVYIIKTDDKMITLFINDTIKIYSGLRIIAK